MIRSGARGSQGIVPIYTSGGLQDGYKMWIGSATTDALGAWSVDYSVAGFTVPPIVKPQAVSSANTPAAAVEVSITAPDSQTVSGACYVANVISLLGDSPLKKVGAGIVVQLIVVGK